MIWPNEFAQLMIDLMGVAPGNQKHLVMVAMSSIIVYYIAVIGIPAATIAFVLGRKK